MANQVNPPRPKSKRDVLNPRKRIFYKDGNSSMLFCKDITTNAAKVLVSSIKDNMEKLNVKLSGHFLIVQ